MKGHDKLNGSDDKPTKSDSAATAPEELNNNISTPSTSPTVGGGGGFSLIGSSEIDSITQGSSPKKLRISDMLNVDSKPADAESDAMSIKFGIDRQGRDNNNNNSNNNNSFTLMGAPANFIGGFGSYPIGELGRFGAEQFQPAYSGNGVSLTLGLPHCDNHLSMSGAHQSFLPNQSMQLGRGVEIGEANDYGGLNAAANGNVYENINIQNRKRFAAQLLPDFVA